MAAKVSPDLLLAKTLAAPFTPRSQGNPLSCRRLVNGGLVVIAADGRKLWFSAQEVADAQADLEKNLFQEERTAAQHRARVPAHPDNGQPKPGKNHKNQMKK